MSLDGQRLSQNRYTVIPRTLSFLIRPGEVLLMRVGSDHRSWSGRLNGVGGHIEQGENPLDSAYREILEETGLTARDLRLTGVVLVDTGQETGIGLYVFVGKAEDGQISAADEGDPGWYPMSDLDQFALVEDVHAILPRALKSYAGQAPFSALYTYSSSGDLQIRFHE